MVSLMKMVIQKAESAMHITLDPHSFMFERFKAHLRYMIVQIREGERITLDMDDYARTQFPEMYQLAEELCSQIGAEMKRDVPREAIGHLAIHMERLRR